MSTDILNKLDRIEQKLDEQASSTKDVLNFHEACRYLGISESHGYKLTSAGRIPHYKPEGKRIYFNRQELDQWMQRNRVKTADEIEQEATNYTTLNDQGGAK